MYPMPGSCPVCGGELLVTRLHCAACDVTIEGRFNTGSPLYRLSAEQVDFVETFVRCEGKLNRVQAELGISYPTVRARLEETIRTMGFDIPGDYTAQPGGLDEDERRQVLEQLERGEITGEEAVRLLRGQV
jgi:hypothetical protein